MKKIKLALLITMLFFGISSTYAQTPSFIVDWNPCELQISNSRYVVTYAIYNTTSQTFEMAPTQSNTFYDQNDLFGTVEIENWSCMDNDTKPYLYLFVHVELKDNFGLGTTYCTGDGRSTLLTCKELYDNATTITVNMIQ